MKTGKRKIIFVSMVLSLMASSAQTIDLNPATIKAQVAGYKAAFTCSATFNGGKSFDMIKQDELTGIRVDYREYYDALPDAKIHTKEKYVSAWYSDAMPPRFAVWRPGLGCTQLPTGADLSMREHVATADLSYMRIMSIEPWPFGNGVSERGNTTEALQEIINDAFTTHKYGDPTVMSAALVTTPDKLLIEQYKADYTPYTSQRTWSTAKSIAASVIGVAVEKGLLDVKAPANIPEWSAPGDPRQKITLENLLHMASGLDSTAAGNRTSFVYYGGSLVTDKATRNMLEAAPGSRYKYANNDTMLAIRSLRATLDDDDKMLKFPAEELFRKIGMHNTIAETDWQGNFIMSSQVWTTPRDLARLGILYLNDGLWRGKRILPEGWRDYVSTAAPAQPPKFRRDGSVSAGYGAQFWLYPSRFSGMPDDAFSSAGNRGQYMMIIPSRNLVIIRRGYDSADGQRFDIARFSADILKALE